MRVLFYSTMFAAASAALSLNQLTSEIMYAPSDVDQEQIYAEESRKLGKGTKTSGSNNQKMEMAMQGAEAAMNVLKEPQVQECLSAAFNGKVPKDLSAENLNDVISTE